MRGTAPFPRSDAWEVGIPDNCLGSLRVRVTSMVCPSFDQVSQIDGLCRIAEHLSISQYSAERFLVVFKLCRCNVGKEFLPPRFGAGPYKDTKHYCRSGKRMKEQTLSLVCYPAKRDLLAAYLVKPQIEPCISG